MTSAMFSPCVGICTMSADNGPCEGCARTQEEIRDWSSYDNDRKRAVYQALPERRARLGLGAPVVGHPVAVLDRLVLGSLDDPKARWAIGVPGAMATFCPGDGTLVTARLWEYGGDAISGHGGARVVLDHGAKKITPIGTVDPETGLIIRLDLCLAIQKGVMSQRRVLTEIGLDTEALRVGDRRGVLFDLGLGLPHIDICARVDDEALLGLLRAQGGRSVLETGSPILAALEEAQAHRVALTRLGRIEAWGSPAPRPEASEECPGTAVTLKPEALTREMPAAPIPASLYPLITLFPGRRLSLC